MTQSPRHSVCHSVSSLHFVRTEPNAKPARTVKELLFLIEKDILYLLPLTKRNCFIIEHINSSLPENFQCVPTPTVFKKPFLTRCGIRCRSLSRRALFHIQVWGIVPLERARCKVFLSYFQGPPSPFFMSKEQAIFKAKTTESLRRYIKE